MVDGLWVPITDLVVLELASVCGFVGLTWYEFVVDMD